MDATAEQTQGLVIARKMIEAGIPIFAAPPCPGASCNRPKHRDGKQQFDLPPKWQLTVPSEVWLERWRPGWGLGAVGGHVADFLDEDPRSGGDASIEYLISNGLMPRVFGVQETPSGGRHYVISPLHEQETNRFLPGLDYQGGLPDGKGRAFVWIAPTVRRAKVAPYEDRPYRWAQEPDLDYLLDFGDSDDSITGLRDVILARKVKSPGNEPDRSGMERRAFTEPEAQRFCSITLERLEQAQIGQIEELANAAACQLSHFVPEFWTEEFAYAVLSESLARTSYDPDGPSEWTAEKFHDVLAGTDGRAPGDWEAVRAPETIDEVVPDGDAVDALLAEMLTPSQVAKRPPPTPLIKGLLNLDSESWIIGAPGSKKSFVVLDMAAHIAAGTPWQERRVTQGPVVMIVAEGAGGLGPRIRAWEMAHGQPMSEDIHVLPRPVQAASLEAWGVLVEACRRLKPVMVVLDTQARVTVGLDENGAKDMGIFTEAVRALREATGGCITPVHHTGRSGGDARGSSAIDGAQHSELKVVAEKGSLHGTLVSEKQKDMELAPDIALTFVVHTIGQDENGDPVTSLAVAPDGFSALAGRSDVPIDPAGSVRVPEPEDWAIDLVPGSAGIDVIKRQILQTIEHLAGQEGRTEAEIRKSVTERWYADRPATRGRTARGVDSQTWNKAWTGVRALEVEGEPAVVPGSAARRFVLNPLATGQ